MPLGIRLPASLAGQSSSRHLARTGQRPHQAPARTSIDIRTSATGSASLSDTDRRLSVRGSIERHGLEQVCANVSGAGQAFMRRALFVSSPLRVYCHVLQGDRPVVLNNACTHRGNLEQNVVRHERSRPLHGLTVGPNSHIHVCIRHQTRMLT